MKRAFALFATVASLSCASSSTKPAEAPARPHLSDREIDCVFATMAIPDIDFFRVCGVDRANGPAISALLFGFLEGYTKMRELEAIDEFRKHAPQEKPSFYDNSRDRVQ